MQTKKITNILFLLSIIILLFGSGYKLGEYKSTHSSIQRSDFTFSNTANNSKNIDFGLFWDAWQKLDQKFIDKKKLDPKKMFSGAVKGMVASLEDPYTFFMTPDENKQSKDDLSGKFEGIGAQLGLKDSRIVVIAPLNKSPAEIAGVKSGDYINKVDDLPTKSWTLSQAVSKIRGNKGTKVKLMLERNGKEFEITIVRDQIHVSSVDIAYEKLNTCINNCAMVAYLKLNQFGETTNDEWDNAINEIKTKWDRKEVKGMVIDLRDNPGGYLDSSVYLAAEFLSQGKIVVKQESTNKTDRTYYVDRNGKLLDIPLVVIINKGSASASEILAGALRDYKRAKLVGEKSFGKGSVQEAIELKDGAGLHVTVAKWILPNGDWINGKGIEPEVKVNINIKEGNTLTRETDDQLEKAIELVLQ